MGGGKSQTSTQQVTIPPEVMARYNAVNARAETAAATPFQAYGGEFVAPLTAPQQTGIQQTGQASQLAQPFYGAGAGLTLNAAQGVGPLTQGQIGYYQNPYTQAVVDPTVRAMQQQQGQQLSQQQTEAIKGGAFGGERAGIQRAQLMGQQGLAQAQAIAPLYQQGYGQAVQTAMGQQGVIASDLARQMQAGQQLAGLGTGAQAAALQGAQANIGAGTLQQQTQQAQDTAQYQQFLQERGYPFQVAQFLANIAEGTGALSGSTTTGTQPSSMFSDKRLKHDAHKIGETNDGQPIYSFKYNGDNHTQLGLMAQDVEKSHPEAVGESHGYKTVDYEKATKGSRKAYGGGLDPNSMGGAVMEPGAFSRGGYALDGAVVDATDMRALLAQQAKSFGPFSQQGLYGGSSQGMPMGGTGVVPQQAMHVPSPIKPGALPKPADSGASQVYSGYQQLNKIADDMTGKGLTRRGGEYAFGKDAVGATYDKAGKEITAAQPASKGLLGGLFSSNTNANVPVEQSGQATPVSTTPETPPVDAAPGPFANGGGIMPRHHYAGGGDIVPGKTEGDDQLGGVLDAQENEKHEMLKPADMGKPGGGSGIGKGLGSIAGGIAGSFFGPLGTMVGSGLGGMLGGAMHDGGVVPRQHFQAAGVVSNVPADYSEEADLPSPGAREAGLVVPPSDHDPDASFNRSVTNLLRREGGLGIDNNGARVNYGFNQAFHPDIDVRELTPEKATQRYRTDYWNAIGGDKLHPDLANVALDTAAMAGPGKANQLLRSSNGDPVEMLNQRHQFLANLVASGNPKYGVKEASAWQGRYENMMNELGAKPQSNLMDYLPSGPREGQREGQPQKAKGVEPAGFFDGIGMNKQTIVPLLEGLAGMAGSKSRYLGSAILEGLGAGAKSYGDVQAQQAGLESSKAGTEEKQAQTQAVLANIAKSAGIYSPTGQLTGYRVYINGRLSTVPVAEFRRAFLAGTPYETAPNVGEKGGVNAPAPAGREDGTGKLVTSTIPPSDNKVEAIQPGVNYDTQARASALNDANSINITPEESQKVKANIGAAAAAASANNSTINSLTKNTADLIANPGTGTGVGSEYRQKILSTANFIYKAATGNDLPEGYDGSNQEINKKITSFLAGLQTSSINQNNAVAFVGAMKGTPSANLTPRALASITSMVVMNNARNQELQPFANQFSNDADGRLSANIYTEYDRLHGKQLQNEQHNLENIYVKYPRFVQKMASGEIPYDVGQDVIKKIYPKTPDLIRHLTRR